jgi:two-component system OmpR family response regulator
MNVPNILLVEDDGELRDLLTRRLSGEGWNVRSVGDGDAAVASVRAEPPDVIVLDVGLPGRDGFDVCREVRSFHEGPILFLTARDSELDEVLGLELGGDDYVVKPVTTRVLAARIRNLLRRRERRPGRVAFGPFVADRTRREVRAGETVVPLTTAEFDLVALLAEHAGTGVDRDTLYRELVGVEYDGLDRTIDVQVARVRQKLGGAHPDGRDAIRTIRGTGYLAIPGSA